MAPEVDAEASPTPAPTTAACDNNDCDLTTTECEEDPTSQPPYVCSCLDGMVPDAVSNSFTSCVEGTFADKLEREDQVPVEDVAPVASKDDGVLTFAPTAVPDGSVGADGASGDEEDDAPSACDYNDCDLTTTECEEDPTSQPPYVCSCLDGMCRML